jgi:hypothetical protein
MLQWLWYCMQDVPAVSNAAAAAAGGPTDMELEAEADVGVGVDPGQTSAGVRTEGVQDAAAAQIPGDAGSNHDQ